MSGRSRQLIVVLLLATLALLTIGCFGGGGSTQTTAIGTLVTSSGGSVGTGTLSDQEVLTIIDGLPAEFTAAFQKRPIVVLFYVPGNADDKSVLDSLNRLKSSFAQYTFLLYDYKKPDSYGTLAQLLKVDYPPFLVLTDAAGHARKIFKGYVDEGTLNQELVNLGRQ